MLPHLAGFQNIDLFFIHGVPVLFQEAITLILNLEQQNNMYKNMQKKWIIILSYFILDYFLYPSLLHI